MEIFKIKELSFSYPNTNTRALSQISFEVNQGDFVLIVGGTGSGKTTLLKSLKPQLSPVGDYKGDIEFCSKNLNAADNTSVEIGFVMQNIDSQIVCDKVWKELAFGLENMALDKNTISRRIGEMASFFGIAHLIDKQTNQLSGGQKQLLNLASVMVMRPKVLLLDEPTSQLDPIAASEFLGVLDRINKQFDTTIIIVEHRVEELFEMAKKIAVLDNGELVYFDTPRNVGRMLNEQICKTVALPTSVRIFNALESQSDKACPLNTQQGRQYIRNNFDNAIKTIDKPNKSISQQVVIQAKNVWFKYDKNMHDVLKGVDLCINKGEIFCLMGGNGVGKSTLLKAISGQIKPYQGKIKILEKNVNEYKGNSLYKQNLAYLVQNTDQIFLKDNVNEDFLDICKVLEYDRAQEYIDICLTNLGVLNLKNANPFDVSGGQQQKLAIAKILLTQPKIILMDEPTKGIDSGSKKALINTLRQLSDKGITIIIVSHDLEFCGEVADRCAMMFDGKVGVKEKTDEFFDGNSFYTTIANRIATGYFKKCVVAEDVIELCRLNKRKQ